MEESISHASGVMRGKARRICWNAREARPPGFPVKEKRRQETVKEWQYDEI